MAHRHSDSKDIMLQDTTNVSVTSGNHDEETSDIADAAFGEKIPDSEYLTGWKLHVLSAAYATTRLKLVIMKLADNSVQASASTLCSPNGSYDC